MSPASEFSDEHPEVFALNKSVQREYQAQDLNKVWYSAKSPWNKEKTLTGVRKSGMACYCILRGKGVYLKTHENPRR